MLPNFQFSIFNFQSKLKFLKFKFQIILTLSLFLLSTFYFLSSPLIAHAVSQIASAQSAVTTSSTDSSVPSSLHNWTQTVMIEVMSSLTCQIAGIDPINPKQSCLGADQKSGKIGFLPSAQKGGAIGFMGTMITALYTPPLHTADYFQNLAQNFGITKKTYAATGTGFDSLSPLMNIWTAFRNIVYLILVIIFVIIGLAIMLRVKIDPRTVMTIQNQIPKIIVGILAVTFSFAIAGFLIDMMWILIYLIYGVISGANLPNVDVSNLNPAIIQGKNAISAAGGIGHVSGIASNVSFGLGSAVKDAFGVEGCSNIATCMNSLFNPLNFIVRPFTPSAIGFNPFELIFDLVSGAAGGIIYWNIAHVPPGATPVVADIINTIKNIAGIPVAIATYAGTQFLLREGLPWIISYLIIFVALLTALFRLWFMLLMSYVYILLDIVFAPFWIIGGIIPGSPISISGWLKDIGANLLAFPATIAMFLLGKVFTDAFANSNANVFIPPLIGNSGDPKIIGSLIGLGILLITPNTVNLLKQMLKAPKTDMGIGKAFAPGLATPGRLIGGAMNYTTGVHYEQVPGGAPGQMQMVAKGGAIGRILRATGLSH